MWVLRTLAVLAVAVAANVLFWRLDPSPWLVIGFNVLFLAPLLWAFPGAGEGSYPSVDESLDRLRRAGWSIGETGTATRWIVSGANGENLIQSEGRTQAEAWARACEQARAVGMLAPPRGEACDRL
jgi:hypothetical protein